VHCGRDVNGVFRISCVRLSTLDERKEEENATTLHVVLKNSLNFQSGAPQSELCAAKTDCPVAGSRKCGERSCCILVSFDGRDIATVFTTPRRLP
jgi:hypothetical protein